MKHLLLAATLLAALASPPMASAQEPPPPAPTRPTDPLGFGALTKDRPKGSTTEITAQKDATFDEKGNRAVFTGDVRVKDPAFLLTSDLLTVYLNKDRSAIDRAVASGNVVIVQQTGDPTKKGAVAHAQEAVYVPSTGTVNLNGWPQIQQGINRHIATDANTTMILRSDGRASTEGASKTVITDTDKPPGLP